MWQTGRHSWSHQCPAGVSHRYNPAISPGAQAWPPSGFPASFRAAMLIWFVIIYWVISVGIGLWAALRVRNTADFAVAGRGLPFYVVTATVFATWFGSETVLGIPSVF